MKHIRSSIFWYIKLEREKGQGTRVFVCVPSSHSHFPLALQPCCRGLQPVFFYSPIHCTATTEARKSKILIGKQHSRDFPVFPLSIIYRDKSMEALLSKILYCQPCCLTYLLSFKRDHTFVLEKPLFSFISNLI